MTRAPTRVMTRPRPIPDACLLDAELWDSPERLTDADLFACANPGWRRSDCPLDDPEDAR
jgi:hypothetical protein